MKVRAASFVALFALAGAVASSTGCAAPVEEDQDGAGSGDALSSSTNPKALFDLPFYFSVNASSMTQMTRAERQHPWSTFWNPAREGGEKTGLRVIAIPDGERSRMSEKLAATGIMQAGDVLLTFRPGLSTTLPYAHLQMGTTHAGIVRILPNGRANSVDQPLDSEHNSSNSTPFASKHYTGAPAIHIVRPRAMREPGMKERLDFWLNKAQALVDKQGRPGFNDNYLTPATAHPKFAGNPAKLALAIGGGLLSGNVRGALGIDMNGDAANEQQLFCSEMVYHLLTLAHCSQGEIQSGATSGEVPACLQNAPFDQMPFAGANAPGGLGEGPLMVALQEPQALVPQLGSVFCTTGAACDPESSELSSGHRKANTELLAAQVPQALGLVYQVRGTNPNAPLPAQAAPIATKIPANYSPTAFLIETLREENARTFDYVATVVFADNAQIAKAKTLSANPIPKTDGAN